MAHGSVLWGFLQSGLAGLGKTCSLTQDLFLKLVWLLQEFACSVHSFQAQNMENWVPFYWIPIVFDGVEMRCVEINKLAISAGFFGFNGLY